MSEAEVTISREEQMLGELAELDLALAKRVHAKAMAAEEPDQINSLSRTYQRVARSVRQTLALKARMQLQREKAAREAPPAPIVRDPVRIARRADDLRVAVKRVISAEYEYEYENDRDEGMRDYLRGLLEECLVDGSADDGFGLEPLDQHIFAVCRSLGLPELTAAGWRDLPDPAWADDPPPWEGDEEYDDEDEPETGPPPSRGPVQSRPPDSSA